MNKTFLTIILAAVLSSGAVAHAIGGSEGGGGGAQIESAFRIRARELTSAVAAFEKANALCPAAAMKKALSSAVRIVKELVDPNGRCKASQELDACSYPGDIQLKQDAWERIVTQPQTQIGNRSMDALILHEVYRASEGCNDENFVITDQVFPLVQWTPSTSAEPKYTWSSCFVSEIKRDKSGKEETVETSLEDVYVKWMDGTKLFILSGREYEISGVKSGSIDQNLTMRTYVSEMETYKVKGTYFDISPEGIVTTEPHERNFEAHGPPNKREVTDITYADSSKDLGKVIHNVSQTPDGVETRIEEQVGPDPVDANGVQRISHKTICTIKPILPENVDFSGIFKVKAQVQRFSKSHEKAILAKDLWQTCQEKIPAMNCDLQKSAYNRADSDRMYIWNVLIKKSDLGTVATPKKSTPVHTDPNRCDSPQMRQWFISCIDYRPNCSDLQPGGRCYGVDGTYARCTGRRPPMRPC